MNNSFKDVITLKSKLRLPRIDATLDRDRLLETLKHFQELKLVGIIAGAGYGKSTLAAQVCRNLGMKTVWYCTDSSDGDVVTLLHYLIAGIRQHYSSFGEITLARLESLENMIMELLSIGKVLLHEMEQTIDAPLALVLDDFHLVQDHPEVVGMVNFLLANLPERVHLMVVSRSDLKIDLASLIVKREALVVGENELAFTAVEIKAMYQQVFQRSLTDQELEILQHKTAGWAAGLVLCHFSFQQQRSGVFETQLTLLNGASGFFEEYLEKNVLNLLSFKTIAFLLKTACLPRLEVRCCNQLLGIDNAGQILQGLEKQHLFTFASDQEGHTYHYHHLFRDFLRKKLERDTDPSELKRLHLRTAEWMQANHEFNEAISFYLKAEDFDAAAKLLIHEGSGMVDSGQVHQVLSLYEKMPQKILEKKPWLMCPLGEAQIQCGKTQEALECFERAQNYFETQGDRDGVGHCLARLGTLYFFHGDFGKAEDLYNKVFDIASPASKIYGETLRNLLYLNTHNGNLDAAHDYYQKIIANVDLTRESPELAEIYTCYAHCLFARDEASQLEIYGRKIWKLSKRFKKNKLMSLSRIILSWVCFLQGEFDSGYKEAVKGTEILEKYGYLDHNYSWCHVYTAWSLTGAKRYSLALDHCRYSLDRCKETLSLWTKAYVHGTTAFIHAKTGNIESTKISVQKAMDSVDPALLEFDRNNLMLVIGWALLFIGETDHAMELVQATRNDTFNSKIRQRWRALFYVRWNWEQAKFKIALKKLKEVLETLTGNEKDFFWMDQQEWIVPLLVEIYAENLYQEKIPALLSHFGPENLSDLKKLSQSDKAPLRNAAQSLLKAIRGKNHQDLHIQCFGSFRLIRGEVEITPDQWVSDKAKTLFKYLAVHASQGFISKDELLELLWPEQDPTITSKRLNVALSTIRKVLEPELARGETSAYLVRAKDAYRLTCGKKGSVDVAQFGQCLTEAQETQDSQRKFKYYLAAEKLYRGQLFADAPFSQWCHDLREKYQEKYIKLLLNISDHYHSAGDLDQAIEYLCLALERDEHTEDIYRRLMSLYHQIGNRIMAKRTYERCRQKLETELECPLSDDTRLLYQKIMA